MQKMQITITRPDDWHLHLRDGEALASVLPHSARQFARAIVMPNLRPPVTTVAAAAEYRQRILAAVPQGMCFEPLMTLYLTDKTPADEIRRAVESGFVKAVKLYPAGATTNSDAGVTDLAKCARRQGGVLWLCGVLYGACGAGTLRRGVCQRGRAGQVGSFCQLPWPGFLPVAAQ